MDQPHSTCPNNTCTLLGLVKEGLKKYVLKLAKGVFKPPYSLGTKVSREAKFGGGEGFMYYP